MQFLLMRNIINMEYLGAASMGLNISFNELDSAGNCRKVLKNCQIAPTICRKVLKIVG